MDAAIHDHTWENWTDDKKEAEERMETPILPESCQKMPMQPKPKQLDGTTSKSGSGLVKDGPANHGFSHRKHNHGPEIGRLLATVLQLAGGSRPAKHPPPPQVPTAKRKLPPPLKVVGSPPHRYCSCAPYRRPCCLTCF